MKLSGLHTLLAFALVLAGAGAALAAGDWDDEAAKRKAAYIFLDAMNDMNEENYTDYTGKLRRAVSLDPADADISAEYADLLLQTTELDSAEAEKAYEALWARFNADRSEWANATPVVDMAQRMGRLNHVAAVWKPCL